MSAIAAVGVSPIVRIPDMQSWMIKRKSIARYPDAQMLTAHQALSTAVLTV